MGSIYSAAWYPTSAHNEANAFGSAKLFCSVSAQKVKSSTQASRAVTHKQVHRGSHTAT